MIYTSGHKRRIKTRRRPPVVNYTGYLVFFDSDKYHSSYRGNGTLLESPHKLRQLVNLGQAFSVYLRPARSVDQHL